MVDVYALPGASVQSSSSLVLLHFEDCMVVLGTVTGEGSKGETDERSDLLQGGGPVVKLIEASKLWTVIFSATAR